MSFVNRDVCDGELVSAERESRKLRKKFDGLLDAVSQMLAMLSSQPTMSTTNELDLLIKKVNKLKDE